MTAQLLAALLADLLLGAAEPMKIATLQLEGSGVPPEMVESATILVPTEVRRARPDAQVISSEDVRSLLTHQKNRIVLGCGTDQACLVDIGGALGVDEIVAGRLGRLGATWVLELRRVDVKKAKNLASATRAVKDAEGLVGAVRSAAGELYAAAFSPPPEGEGARPGPLVIRPDDPNLPAPSVEERELEFEPIGYKGTRHRLAYDQVRGVVLAAKLPIEQERTEDDSALRLRTDWVVIERGRRMRFRIRVDGKVGFDVDRESCDDHGCRETWDASRAEIKLATDLYAAIRAPVEKGRF